MKLPNLRRLKPGDLLRVRLLTRGQTSPHSVAFHIDYFDHSLDSNYADFTFKIPNESIAVFLEHRRPLPKNTSHDWVWENAYVKILWEEKVCWINTKNILFFRGLRKEEM